MPSRGVDGKMEERPTIGNLLFLVQLDGEKKRAEYVFLHHIP